MLLQRRGRQADQARRDAGVIQGLQERIAKLEAASRQVPKGKAFIKPKDRPAVGKAKTLKRRDR